MPFLTNSTRSNQKTKTLAADHTHSRHSHNHIILNITLTRLVSIFKSFHLLNYSFLTSTKQGSRNRHLFRSIFFFCEINSAENSVLTNFEVSISLILSPLHHYFTHWSISILSIDVGASRNLSIIKIRDNSFCLAREISLD